MRGKLNVGSLSRRRPGSIPAHAGETLWCIATSLSTRVHPRACGGNLSAASRRSRVGGPSPRMRGKLRDRPHAVVRDGSIPAHAGETNPETEFFSSTKVHPRACGGNEPGDGVLQLHEGPSPRMRGKLLHMVYGFIGTPNRPLGSSRLTTYSAGRRHPLVVLAPPRMRGYREMGTTLGFEYAAYTGSVTQSSSSFVAHLPFNLQFSKNGLVHRVVSAEREGHPHGQRVPSRALRARESLGHPGRCCRAMS